LRSRRRETHPDRNVARSHDSTCGSSPTSLEAVGFLFVLRTVVLELRRCLLSTLRIHPPRKPPGLPLHLLRPACRPGRRNGHAKEGFRRGIKPPPSPDLGMGCCGSEVGHYNTITQHLGFCCNYTAIVMEVSSDLRSRLRNRMRFKYAYNFSRELIPC
jgi:hypothetical protein